MDGVVAQLGERLLDVQEVCGSSPHGPTADDESHGFMPVTFLLFYFCPAFLCPLLSSFWAW